MADSLITVNSNTNNPDLAWDLLKNLVKKDTLERLPLDTPIYEDKIRFVCISDTHSRHSKMHYEIPAGDVLIHAGDFTNMGSVDDVVKFSEFLSSLDSKFKHKIVIAGNHELSFDPEAKRNFSTRIPTKQNEKDPRDFLKNCIYLQDSMVELFGIKIYGSPWQPRFGNWAFNVNRGQELLDKWNKIPNDTDILITHGPPLGFGDKVNGGYHVGCCELLSTIRQRVKPKYHIFGHIHEDPGIWTDNITTFINPSICNFNYIPANPPVIFDFKLPEMQKKMDFS